jgi:hypothetical protein
MLLLDDFVDPCLANGVSGVGTQSPIDILETQEGIRISEADITTDSDDWAN